MRNSIRFTIFLLLVGFCHSKRLYAQERPNIILILADDLGYGDLGCTGSQEIRTPHIDRLASQAVFLEQGYVSSPVCSPSRAGLLTGRHQVEFGHDNNIDRNQPGFDPHYLGLPLSERTIADYLTLAGYQTGLVGKWHLGEADHFHPKNRGFQWFWGFLGGGHDYFEADKNKDGYQCAIEANGELLDSLPYLTDALGDACVSFIQQQPDRPFFLFASFNAPHTPMQALETDLSRYAHITDEKRRTYAAMVHRLDVNVGKIMAALEQAHIAENTLVVFLSDNGGPVRMNASLNAPFHGQKGTLYEGGIRVPMMIRWPANIQGGKRYSFPVSALDLTPTLLAAADAMPSDVDFSGVNLLPYLQGDSLAPPHSRFLWRFTIGAAILQENWKLIRLPDRLPMLFDLSQDPGEQNDLALDRLQVTRELLDSLGQWDIDLPHPLFLEGAQWKRHNIQRYDMEYRREQP